MYKHCIGIDVSKNKLDVLWLKDPQTRKAKTKVFLNTIEGSKALLAWSLDVTGLTLDDLVFAMEATGVYHELLAQTLADLGGRVVIANPQQVHNYAKGLGVRTKTDKRDSFVIAHYTCALCPPLWQPPAPEIRQLKALIARLEAIEQDLQRELNRLEKAQVGHAPEMVVASLQKSIAHLTTEKQHFEQLIRDHIDQNPNLKQDRALLESIPGVGPVISARMIALIRSRTFKNAAQLAAFCGLVPVEKLSGTSVRGKPRLSKNGSSKLRAKLYMAAVCAIRHNPTIQRHYQQLVQRGKTKMSALGAAMRKMVHICFGVLKHQVPFKASGTCV